MRNKIPPFPILFGTMLLDMIGFGLVVPLLPFYAEAFGGSGAEVGLLVAIFALGQLVAAPIWGRLSDRFGRRRLLLISVIGSILAYAALPFAPSLLWLYAIRLVAGIMTGNMTIVQAYIADITPPAQRSRRMGTLGIAFGVGFIIGPALGGVAGHYGLSVPMFAAAGALLVNLLFITFFLPEPAKHVETPSESTTLQAVFHPELLKLFGAGLLVMMAFAGMQGTFALLTAKEFGFGPQEVGWIMAYIGAVVVAARLILGKLITLLGEHWLLVAGALTISLGLLLVPLAPTWPILLLVTTLLPLGMSAFNPSFMGLVSGQAPAAKRGVVMGSANTALGIGQVAGPILAGFLFDAVSPFAAFATGAGIAVLAAGVALWANCKPADRSAEGQVAEILH